MYIDIHILITRSVFNVLVSIFCKKRKVASSSEFLNDNEARKNMHNYFFNIFFVTIMARFFIVWRREERMLEQLKMFHAFAGPSHIRCHQTSRRLPYTYSTRSFAVHTLTHTLFLTLTNVITHFHKKNRKVNKRAL